MGWVSAALAATTLANALFSLMTGRFFVIP